MHVVATESFQLPNGLEVVMLKLQHIPAVCSLMHYAVGSGLERPGERGVTHFLEHMFFSDARTYGTRPVHQTLARLGGEWNAWTDRDATCHLIALPSSQLDFALDLEADRMSRLRFDPDRVEAERAVIAAERRQREGSASFRLLDAFLERVFAGSSYAHHALGSLEDIHAISLTDLERYYADYIGPANATLILTGDLDFEFVHRRVTHWFGSLPSGVKVTPTVIADLQQTEQRLTVPFPSASPHVLMGFKTVPADHADTSALIVLSSVLSGGHSFLSQGMGHKLGSSSLLHMRLVESGLAQKVNTRPWLLTKAGLFTIGFAPRNGVSPSVAEGRVLDEIERLKESLVPEDVVRRAVRQIDAQVRYTMQSNPTAAAFLATVCLPMGYRSARSFMQALAAVTPEDVQRVVRTYFRAERRTVAWLVPGDPGAVSFPVHSTEAAQRRHVPLGVQTAAATTGGRELLESVSWTPPLERFHTPGGGTLLVYRSPGFPGVHVRVQLAVGSIHADRDKAGLPQLVGEMLHPAAGRDGPVRAAWLDDRAISLQVDVLPESTVLSVWCLPEDLDGVAELIRVRLAHPDYSPEDIRTARHRLAAKLLQQRKHSRYVAYRALLGLLYPEGHPFRRIPEVESTLERISADDIEKFHKDWLTASRCVITVIGDVDTDDVRRAFEDVVPRGGRVQDPVFPPPVGKPSQVRVPVTGNVLTSVAIGWPTVPRNHEDYLPLWALAYALGGNGAATFSPRLLQTLRNACGLSYHVSTQFGSSKGQTPWTIHVGVHAAQVAQALDVIRDEMERVCTTPMPADELTSIQRFLINHFLVAHDRVDRLAEFFTSVEEYDLGMEYPQRMITEIQALTSEQLLTVAAKYLNPDAASVAVAGPQ